MDKHRHDSSPIHLFDVANLSPVYVFVFLCFLNASHSHLHEFYLASMQNISRWFSEVSCVTPHRELEITHGWVEGLRRTRAMRLSVQILNRATIYLLYSIHYLIPDINT